MDNFQLWLYVIVAIIYVLSRALKKKVPEPGDAPQQPPGRSSSQPGSPRQPTFEELLREITEGKTTPSQPKQAVPSSYEPPVSRTPLPPAKPAYVDYDDDLQQEEQDLEDTNYDYRTKDKLYDVYEEAKKQAFVPHSYDDEAGMPESVLKYGRFAKFGTTTKATLSSKYAAELRKPGGFKKAVVLSEILNRKY